MFRSELENACAAAGVALVVLQAPKECKASGATIIQKNDQALLVLSHRHKTDDHFWFSFFHEAAHILLHRGHDLIVEHDDDQSQIEREANAFASEVLVPKSEWARLAKMRLTYMSVIREARTLGISPGMLVGQLQHKGLLPRNRLNKLKRKFEWAY
jgi:Zn-dependent peptidase ImmA (M78 family)